MNVTYTYSNQEVLTNKVIRLSICLCSTVEMMELVKYL